MYAEINEQKDLNGIRKKNDEQEIFFITKT